MAGRDPLDAACALPEARTLMVMKAMMGLWALVALGASRVAAQGEARWTEVFSDTTEVVSIDAASVTSLGDSVYRVWERSVSRPSNEVRVLARADFDCRLRLTRAVAVTLPGFAPVPVSDIDREWVEIVPGSSAEAEWRQVCGGGR
jgi:hypothetical protein